jgi:hypothetical protein
MDPSGFTTGVFGGRPSSVLRFDPRTGLSEIYNAQMPAFGIRGGDIDGNGVVWASLSSGHLASFDRRRCKSPLNCPKATGEHCAEGWSFYKYPGPGFIAQAAAATTPAFCLLTSLRAGR